MNYNEPKYNAGPIECIVSIGLAATLCYCIYMFIQTYFDLRNMGRINRKEISQAEYEQLDQLIKENPSIKPIVSEHMDDDKISNSEFQKIQEMKFKSRFK
jgi:hypothetical protein